MLDPNNVGDPVEDQDLIDALKAATRRLARVQNENFPGCQPVSVMNAHLEVLRRKDFYVCEKTDGVRYLLLIHTPNRSKTKAWLIDRKYTYYPLKTLPVPLLKRKSTLHDTLLDGELVDEALFKGGAPSERRSTFLVFDAICVYGVYVGHLDLMNRLRVAHETILLIQGKILSSKLLRDELPFEIDLKQMFAKRDTGFLFSQVLPNLTHENDGLVFTRVDAAYEVGTTENVLKWKPRHLISNDFQLQVRWRYEDEERKRKTMRYCVLEASRNGVPERYGTISLDDELQKSTCESIEVKPSSSSVALTKRPGLRDSQTDRNVVLGAVAPGRFVSRADGHGHGRRVARLARSRRQGGRERRADD